MKPLEGIRVLELATYFAAPMCGHILADWGAEVIKVEGPAGDPYRTAYRGQRTPKFDDGCPSFDLENANKKFVCLDAKHPQGREALLKLAAQCDVFLTNNRPRALEKMQMTYEDIKAVNPKIVYADMTGYGSSGPLKDKPGYDYTAFFSRSGLMADLSPKGESVLTTVAGFGDHVCAITLAGGICAALLKAKTTGVGEHVNTALYQSAIFIQGNGLLCTYYGREYPRDHFDCNSPLLTCYKCKDGEWVYLSTPEYNKYWPKICREIFGRPDLADDPRYATIDVANQHKAEAVADLDKVFAEHDSSYWIELFEKNDIPHEKLAHYKDVLTDEQAWANDFLLEHTYAGGECAVFANTPVNFASVGRPDFIPAGAVGADTGAVLGQLGYTPEQIQTMVENGAAAQA